jgi:beta-lactam-binding protein with PASTA domain
VIPIGSLGPVLAAGVEDTRSTPPPLPDFHPRDLVGLSVGEVTDDLADADLPVQREPDVRSDVPAGRVTGVSRVGSSVVVRYSTPPPWRGAGPYHDVITSAVDELPAYELTVYDGPAHLVEPTDQRAAIQRATPSSEPPTRTSSPTSEAPTRTSPPTETSSLTDADTPTGTGTASSP